MNEPKRRGRPPKAQAITEPHINGDTSREPGDVLPVKVEDEIARRRAVGLARRVWDGQSPSLPRKERLERVRKALERQGLSMEGVEL